MTEIFQISSGMLSHPGRKRLNNEDFAIFFEPADPLVLDESGAVYIVADGVGGASEGERASQYAAEKVLHEYYLHPEEEPGVRLKRAMQQASQEIFDYAESGERYKRMATTLVAAVIRRGLLTVAHVGDSRAYLLRDGKTTQLTTDHSVVGELVAQGLMTEEEVLHSKHKNRLTRSLGAEADVIVDVQYDIQLQSGDRLLLCSDGLWGYAVRQKIGEMAVAGTPDDAVARLVDFANRSGGEDNITVIVVSVKTRASTAGSDTVSDTAPRGRLPEKVDWETISTRVDHRSAPPIRSGWLSGLIPARMKKYTMPVTLAIMALVAVGLLVTMGLWKLSGGGSRALITTGMPDPASIQKTGTFIPSPSLSVGASVVTTTSQATPSSTITPSDSPMPVVPAMGAPIPIDSWCVYIIQGDGPDTIREIVEKFGGRYDEELSDLIFAADSGTPWEVIWPDGLDKTIPPSESDGNTFYPRVAISFVDTIEVCEENGGEILPRQGE